MGGKRGQRIPPGREDAALHSLICYSQLTIKLGLCVWTIRPRFCVQKKSFCATISVKGLRRTNDNSHLGSIIRPTQPSDCRLPPTAYPMIPVRSNSSIPYSRCHILFDSISIIWLLEGASKINRCDIHKLVLRQLANGKEQVKKRQERSAESKSGL